MSGGGGLDGGDGAVIVIQPLPRLRDRIRITLTSRYFRLAFFTSVLLLVSLVNIFIRVFGSIILIRYISSSNLGTV